MTLFDPKTIQELGTDSNARTVILGTLYCDTIADLPAPNDFTGFALSMGFRAVVINDNSVHRLNSVGQWVQIVAGNSTYTRAEIDNIVNGINADLLSQQTQIDYLVNTGAKNIIQNTADALRTVAGIDWTKNADDTVTANGTTTGVSALRIVGVQGSSTYANAVPITRGRYIISASGYTDEVYRFAIGIFSDDQSARTTRNIYNTPITIDIESDTARYDFSAVVSRAGVTVSDLVFYPMIRPAIVTDDTYTPYAPTNRQLYELIRGYHP